MAKLILREIPTDSPITTGSSTVKNLPLLNSEIDQNFVNINGELNDKADLETTNIFTDTTDSTSTTTGAIVINGGLGVGGSIYSSTVVATDFNSTSDLVLKENIQEIDGFSLLNKINPVEFTWKDSGKKSYGVIAQEIEQTFPQLVSTDGEGLKSVSYIPIIAILVDAVKKLEAKIIELQNK